MFSISVSILGFLIIKYEFIEIFRDFGLRNLFYFPTMLLLSLLQIVVLKIFYFEPLYLWFFIVILYLFVFFLPVLIRRKFETEMKDEIIIFLDNTILNVQSGCPLRTALVKAIDGFVGWKNTQFKLLINSLLLGQKNEIFQSKTLRKFHQSVARIEGSKTNVLEQLKSYRQQLKMEQNLRHRSRQVTLNLKIQSIVMTVMYILIGFFIFSNFETSHSKSVLLVSGILFGLGQGLVFFVGRSFRWKT